MKKAIAILMMALVLGLPASPALGQTSVSGTISEDTTWTKEGSPYLISGVVEVNNEATLRIEPGVRVEAAPDAALVVERASLLAEGTEDEPVVFTSQTRSGDYHWAGISLLLDPYPYPDLYKDRFQYVEISNALTALHVIEARFELATHLLLDNNVEAIKLDNPKEGIELTDSVLTNNALAISGRVNETATISRNDFWNNLENIVAEPQDPYSCFQGGAWEIHGNDIVRGPANRPHWSYDMRTPIGSSTSEYTVDATDNWWGTTDEIDIAGRFEPSQTCCPEQPVKAITWEPYSSEPHTDWEPQGEVPEPNNEPRLIADPIGWTEMQEPPDRTCIERESVRRVAARMFRALGNPERVVFKIARIGQSGCKTWSHRRARFLPGCRRWVDARVTRYDLHVYRFPRVLTQGRYMIRSAFISGDQREQPMPGMNVVRVNLI